MRLTLILRTIKSTRKFASAKTTSATKQLEKYAVYNPVTLSLKDFVEFGKYTQLFWLLLRGASSRTQNPGIISRRDLKNRGGGVVG